MALEKYYHMTVKEYEEQMKLLEQMAFDATMARDAIDALLQKIIHGDTSKSSAAIAYEIDENLKRIRQDIIEFRYLTLD